MGKFLYMLLQNEKQGITINFADSEKINVYISKNDRIQFRFYDQMGNKVIHYFIKCLSPGCRKRVSNTNE